MLLQQGCKHFSSALQGSIFENMHGRRRPGSHSDFLHLWSDLEVASGCLQCRVTLKQIVLFSWRVLCPPYMHQFFCSFVDSVTVNGTVRRTGACISRITYHFSISSFLSSISTTIPIMGQLGIHPSSPPLSPSPLIHHHRPSPGSISRHTPAHSLSMAGPTQPEIANGLSLACRR